MFIDKKPQARLFPEDNAFAVCSGWRSQLVAKFEDVVEAEREEKQPGRSSNKRRADEVTVVVDHAADAHARQRITPGQGTTEEVS